MLNIKLKLNKIWSFDIDGTLTNYPQVWLNFINQNIGANFESKSEARRELGDHYDQLKHKYRTSNYKYEVDVHSSARNLIDRINEAGGTVLISTSRPFHRYDDMMLRTENWLKSKKINHDIIIPKSELIHHNFYVHIDDQVDEILWLHRQKQSTYILLNDYENTLRGQDLPEQVKVVETLDEIKLEE